LRARVTGEAISAQKVENIVQQMLSNACGRHIAKRAGEIR